jgi:hypothetical protein
MPDLYLGIAHASYQYLNISPSALLPDIDSFVNLSKLMYEKVSEKGEQQLSYAGRSVEFHSFGVVGAPGGELLAPMIWTISHFSQMISNLTNAKVGLIIGGVPEIFFASESLETVYVANTTPVGIMDQVFDATSITNIESLSWDIIRNELPELDMANILLNNLTDDSVTIAIANALKVGGILIVTNASNGSELYMDNNDQSFSEYVHDLILSTCNFESYHFQGYTSFTVFKKK